MQRPQLDTALRAVADVVSGRELILAGSQAIHAHTANPPPEVLVSEECDVWAKGQEEKLEAIAATLGKNSPFHAANGFYVDPVEPGLLLLPMGWESRLNWLRAAQSAIGN